jgi:hypothetical protein
LLWATPAEEAEILNTIAEDANCKALKLIEKMVMGNKDKCP